MTGEQHDRLYWLLKALEAFRQAMKRHGPKPGYRLSVASTKAKIEEMTQ